MMKPFTTPTCSECGGFLAMQLAGRFLFVCTSCSAKFDQQYHLVQKSPKKPDPIEVTYG